MADIKWSAFPDGAAIESGDEVVGLRAGANVRLTANAFDNLTLDGNSITATDTGGNITLIADGTGNVDIFEPPASESSSITVNGATFNTAFRVNDIGTTAPAQSIIHRHSTTLEPALLYARANSDTDSHVAVTNGMALSSSYAAGWTGSQYSLFGQIRISADNSGTISDSSAPGKMELLVSPDGAITPAAAVTIANDKSATFAGNVTVSSGTVDITGQLDVDNLNLNGNTISSQDTNGSIYLTPNGLGVVSNGYMGLKSLTGSEELGTFSVGEQLRFTIFTGGGSVSRPILLRVKFIGGNISSANKSAFFDGIISVVMNGSGTSFFVDNINTLAQNRFIQSDIELRTVGTTTFDIIIRQPESTGNYLVWSCSVESLSAQTSGGFVAAAPVLEAADAYTTPVNCITPVIARGTGYVNLVANDNSIAQVSSSGLTIQGSYTLTAGGTITSTSGINFGQDTLNYYDEGTFTPVLRFGGASVGITYTQQAGFYIRTGSSVWFKIIIVLSAKGSSTGASSISGLPFTAANDNVSGLNGYCPYLSSVTFTANPFAYISDNTAVVNLSRLVSGSLNTNLTDAEFVDTSRALIVGTYDV